MEVVLMSMSVAKIFESGQSQAVRLPKPKMTWEEFFASGPCPEFEIERTGNPPQERELF
jgi:virulence-associated protein VagC